MNRDKSPPNQANLGGTNFLVSVYGHENMNLQGLVQWLDTGKKVHFRSTIELMSLIDEAVSMQTADSTPKRTWGSDKHTNVI